MANTLVSFFQSGQRIIGVMNPLLRHSGNVFTKRFDVRHLYSPVTLGIEGYLQQKERTKTQLANVSSRFREKMLEYTADDSKNIVFTEDLKNMLHLADGDEDLQLIIRMIKRFNQQNKQMRFGSFVFGPVVMRMFHFLNKPNEAFQCFKDPELEGMFDQLMSYQIFLDLLFENQKYNEILEAFELIKNTQIAGIKYAKNVVVLVFATCYKMNTQESYQYAIKLWSELNKIGHFPMRRAITFCAALAINQGKPSAALEILSMSKNSNYTTVRNLKVAALNDIGRTEDAIAVLKSIITEDTATTRPVPTFNCDVVDKTKIAVEKLGNSDITLEFNRVLKYFQEQGHISDMTLDTQLCQEISSPQLLGKRVNENFIRRPFQSHQGKFDGQTIGGRPIRPGLYDLQ